MLGGGRDVEGWRNRDGEMETRDKDREQGDEEHEDMEQEDMEHEDMEDEDMELGMKKMKGANHINCIIIRGGRGGHMARSTDAEVRGPDKSK